MPAEWRWKSDGRSRDEQTDVFGAGGGTRPFWASSQRPLYVRTVWVDGFRHAVLTHDDPALIRRCPQDKHPPTRPASSASVYGTARRASTLVRAKTASWNPLKDPVDQLLTECFVNFNLESIKDPKPSTDTYINTYEEDDTQYAKPAEENPETIELTAHAPVIHKQTNPKPDKREFKTCRGFKQRNNSDQNDDYEDDEGFCDRVLEWVDIAGKSFCAILEDAEPEPCITPASETNVRPPVTRQHLAHRRVNVDEFATLYGMNELDKSCSEATDRSDAMAPRHISYNGGRKNSNIQCDVDEIGYMQPIYFENVPKTKLHIFVPSLLTNN